MYVHVYSTYNVGETLHGLVYPPIGLQEGKQYRTILYVYGGPAIQVHCICVHLYEYVSVCVYMRIIV